MRPVIISLNDAHLPDDPVQILASRLGLRWDHLRRGRERGVAKRRELEESLAAVDGADLDGDATFVVFGSLARDEFTSGSDIDWTLLIDGPADPDHLDTARRIGRFVREVEGKAPGREGVFGSLAFSHELVHLIGGQDDTNSNTTRRILLLLESSSVGNDAAHRRVLHNVLHRYLAEDRGIWFSSSPYKVPRFLLNDFVRYWRTMAVDFAYKQRSRGGEGWALRNLKLRTSRKLIFVAGLLTCFSPETELTEEQRDQIFGAGEQGLAPLVEHFSRFMRATPLEITARAVLGDPKLEAAGGDLFTAYDEFLGLLSDPDCRSRLATLPLEQLGEDSVFRTGTGIGHRFQEALNRIFLEPGSPYYPLILKYGIF